MGFTKLILSLAFLSVALVAGGLGTAYAIPTIDYGMVAPTAGSLSYAGGAAALVGTNISVDNVTGLETPLNNGVSFPCPSCLLNFTTGALTSPWNWAGPGSISLDTGSTNLFSGTFLNASVVSLSGAMVVALTNFTGTNNPLVTDLFGMPSGPGYVGGINLSFQVPTGTVVGGAFDTARGGQLLSGDMAMNVPEPASMLLLGSGLAGIGLWNQRRRKTV